jgi:ElaB/YqjD/DUF883 family membrane-anchored ribosome-binding protein
MSDRSSSVKETVKEMNKATADSQDDIQKDLQNLRRDLTRLTEQVAGVLAARGSKAWRAARAGVDSVVSDAETKGREAKDAVSEVAETFTDALDDSIQRRPYTTLAIALGIGFLFGATWRR